MAFSNRNEDLLPPKTNFLKKLRLDRNLKWFSILGLLFAFGVLFIYGLGKVQQFYNFWNIPSFWIFCLVYFVGIASLKVLFPKLNIYLLAAIFLFSFALINAGFSSINTSLFSSSFSEGSWLFSAHELASFLRTGSAIQGALSNPTLDPTRILLLAVPFLFNIKSLVTIRIYSVLLRVIVTCLTAYFIVRRLKVKQTGLAVALTLWGFLLFNYINVGAHLLIAACLVVAVADNSKPIRTLAIVALASVWAGLSRLNWFPVPAMLAILLYVFEKPFRSNSLFKYFSYPFLIGVTGVVCSCAAYFLYCHFTGTIILFPNPAYHYFYIHSRLLPNKYFLPGTFLASVLLLAPSLLPAFIHVIHKKINILRILVVVIFIMASFIVGLQISSKIGGGYDMHNYDIVFLIAFITFSYIFTGSVVEDIEEKPSNLPLDIAPVWKIAFILAFMFLGLLKPYSTINLLDQSINVQQVQQLLNKYPDGKILFITDQYLPAMGLLNVNHPVYDYDYAVLTEMLMARNNAPVSDFIESVDKRRYTLIVAPNMDEVKLETNEEDPFAQENNLWEPFDEQFSARYVAVLRAGGVIVYAPVKSH